MRTQANGWQYFVSTLLIVTGAINIIQGVAAMFTPEYFVATGSQMLVLDYGGWGVLLGLWGAVLVIAGLSVLSGSTWARVFAVVLASLNAIAQLAFLIAMPLWSVVVIAIDILVIYGLTAGWPAAIRGESEDSAEGSYRAGYRAAHERPAAAPRPTRAPEQGQETGRGAGQHQQPTS
ncbi:DUF7144 family membrane protein [Nocardiopsis ganjiahuensis]|uniref:DUF7144 family membrane protein n=1 Tax=Nocardiopsis ganjiahuensis TaxID=239984 RepID=UPI00034DADBD|nr:hypothetical protein [Nocardiopsis ganjiahuensis]